MDMAGFYDYEGENKLSELISRAESVKDQVTNKQLLLTNQFIATLGDYSLYEQFINSFRYLDVFLNSLIYELVEEWSFYIPPHAYGFYNEQITNIQNQMNLIYSNTKESLSSGIDLANELLGQNEDCNT